MTALSDLTGTNATLTLFGVETEPGRLLALGYHAERSLRAGRVFLDATGRKYRLTRKLRRGLYAVGLPGAELDAPVALEAA